MQEFILQMNKLLKKKQANLLSYKQEQTLLLLIFEVFQKVMRKYEFT